MNPQRKQWARKMSAEDPRKIMLSKKIRRPPRKMLAEDARGRCSRNMRTEYINSRPAANGCLQFRNIIILHISPYPSVLTCVLIPPSFSFCPYPSLLTLPSLSFPPYPCCLIPEMSLKQFERLVVRGRHPRKTAAEDACGRRPRKIRGRQPRKTIKKNFF